MYRAIFARFQGYIEDGGHWPPRDLLKSDLDRAHLYMKTVAMGEVQDKVTV
jgi:hypothetical protein